MVQRRRGQTAVEHVPARENVADNDVEEEVNDLELEDWELNIFNSITSVVGKRDFLRMVHARATLEVVTPLVAAARNGRSSVVSSLTSTVELTAKEKKRLIVEAAGKLFRKWKFVSSAQACYGGMFCEEVFKELDWTMEASTWEGKNGVKRKAMAEICRKRSYLTGRAKQVFVCKFNCSSCGSCVYCI